MDFHIPPQGLAQALDALSRQGQAEIMSDGSALRNQQTPGLTGSYTVRQAVERLLAGTGLVYTFTAENAVAIITNSIFGMANLTGKFSNWGLEHALLIGADYYDSGIDDNGEFLTSAEGVAPINIFNPIYGRGVLTLAGHPNNSSSRLEDSWYGFYLQDQVRFAEHWHLLVGGRHDDASSSQSFVADRSDLKTDSDSEFSPRLGLLYHPIPWLSLYGSYVEGYHHANLGRTTGGTDLEPERSRQYEAGVKGEWWDGMLTSTLAFYHLTKTNITVAHQDPALARQGFVELTGEARSQGIELDISGQLSDDWSLIGSYAYTGTEITEDQGVDELGNLTDGNKGNRLRNVPEHAGSLWVNHQFTEFGWPGLSAGIGVFLASDRVCNFGSFALCVSSLFSSTATPVSR